jgi:glycosyltransferase involved in cell wall biosynthesis
MKISVIISAHKESPYLKDAIVSALDQNFGDYEIILSSDGCDLRTVAKEFGIKYSFCPKSNHSTALNKAVKKAKGEYIKECHYDDILTPNCLQSLWSVAEETGASLIYANALNFWPNGKKDIYKPPVKITWESFWPPVKCPIHSATFLFKRADFLTLGGRDTEMVDSEELDYYMNLFVNGYSFAYCDKITAKYRRHDDQKTSYYSKEKREAVRLHLINKYQDRI